MSGTVHAAFMTTAARTPAAEFLHIEAVTAQAYRIPEGSVSWAEAARRVAALRVAYERAGYGHGHRVGLLLDNRPDFLLHWFALNAVG
ncbi:MAG TPA: ATP-dependent acyl-CoA ligase, partial [Lautropia sp.]|nr:ATP-dependent acyl-CoA ligase [Lautropia sp.]